MKIMENRITALVIEFLLISTLVVVVHAGEPGSLKWKYDTRNHMHINNSPAISREGNIYFG